LEQWFDFSNNSVAFTLKTLSLTDIMPQFQNVKVACSAMNLTTLVDMDALYDEFSVCKDIIQCLVEDRTASSVPAKWVKFFGKCVTIPPNIFTIVSCMLSLPGSNAFPERIFSFPNGAKIEIG